MEIIINLFLCIIYLADPLLWYKVMSSLGLKYRDRKWLYILAVSIYYGIICFKQWGIELFDNQILVTVIDILLPLYIIGITIFLIKDTLIKKILSVGVFYSAMFISESICFLIAVVMLKTPMELFLNDVAINTFWTILAKIILTVIYWLFFFRGRISWINYLYGNKEIVFMLLLNMCYELPLCSLVQREGLQSNPVILLCFSLSQLILIASIGYFWYVLKQKNQRLDYLKCELEVVKQNAGAYKALRQLKHDMGGNVHILLDLCKTQKYAMLEKYIEGMSESVMQADVTFDLPDPALSILVGHLKQKALDNGCRFKFFNTLDNYYMSSNEICSLVSNLINNALEATIKLPQEYRSVNVEFLYIDGGYHVEVCNSAPLGTDVKRFHMTSKKDKENHGLGMDIIHKIADKHKGCVIIRITTGQENDRNYDYVSIKVAMRFKEIEERQLHHNKIVNTSIIGH